MQGIHLLQQVNSEHELLAFLVLGIILGLVIWLLCSFKP